MGKNFFIVGYFGYKNMGDQAMLFVTLREMNKLFPDAKFRVLSREAVVVPSEFKHRIQFVKLNPLQIFRSIMKSSAIIFVGGTHLEDHGTTSLRAFKNIFRILILCVCVRLFKKPIYHVGIGIGPLSRIFSRIMAKYIFVLSKFISVRDSTSYKILKDMNQHYKAIQGFDVSILLEEKIPKESIHERAHSTILGVSVLPHYETYYKSNEMDYLLVNKLEEGIRTWLINDAHSEIYLFLFNGWSKDDLPLIHFLARNLSLGDRVKIIEYTEDPRRMLNFVSKCTHFVSFRFHSALFAYAYDIPFIMIDYHPKCNSLAEFIELPKYATISPEEVLAGKLISRLETLKKCPENFHPILPLEAAKLAAKKCFEKRNFE